MPDTAHWHRPAAHAVTAVGHRRRRTWVISADHPPPPSSRRGEASDGWVSNPLCSRWPRFYRPRGRPLPPPVDAGEERPASDIRCGVVNQPHLVGASSMGGENRTPCRGFGDRCLDQSASPIEEGSRRVRVDDLAATTPSREEGPDPLRGDRHAGTARLLRQVRRPLLIQRHGLRGQVSID